MNRRSDSEAARGDRSGGGRSRLTLALAVAACVLGLAAMLAPAWSPGTWSGGDLLLLALVVAVGASLVLGGLLGLRWRSGRSIARLMLVAACLYFITVVGYAGFPTPQAGFAIGVLTDGAWLAVAAHFVVAFPEGRLRSRLERGVVAAGYAQTLMIRGIALFGQPADWGCADCPPNPVMIARVPEIVAALQAMDSVVPVVVGGLVAWLVWRRWRRASRPERRVLEPVFWAIAVNLVAFLAFAAVNAAAVAGLFPQELRTTAQLAQRTVLVLLPVSFGLGMVRGLVHQSAVGNLLVRIGQGRSVEEIERDVAWALGDPSLRVATGRRGGPFTTAGGDPLQAVAGERGTTIVEGEGESAVALVHDPSLERDQPELLRAVAEATRLAMDNQRLAAEVRLSRELPIGVTERLLREGRRIGETRTMTISVLMSDIRGYSSLAERADLHRLAAQLNEHRASMNRVVAGHGGTVMQFVGDMVFAVFGAPIPSTDHARRAVAAALEMQSTQRALNAAWSEVGLPAFELGIAVTSGPVAAALLGSAEHVEYSVVGDVVNLAQRIQAWAGAGEVMVGAETYAALDDSIPAIELPPAAVKGRAGLVTAYRLAAI